MGFGLDLVGSSLGRKVFKEGCDITRWLDGGGQNRGGKDCRLGETS